MMTKLFVPTLLAFTVTALLIVGHAALLNVVAAV